MVPIGDGSDREQSNQITRRGQSFFDPGLNRDSHGANYMTGRVMVPIDQITRRGQSCFRSFLRRADPAGGDGQQGIPSDHPWILDECGQGRSHLALRLAHGD